MKNSLFAGSGDTIILCLFSAINVLQIKRISISFFGGGGRVELVGNKMETAGQGIDCSIMILLTRDSAGNQHGREGSELHSVPQRTRERVLMGSDPSSCESY